MKHASSQPSWATVTGPRLYGSFRSREAASVTRPRGPRHPLESETDWSHWFMRPPKAESWVGWPSCITRPLAHHNWKLVGFIESRHPQPPQIMSWMTSLDKKTMASWGGCPHCIMRCLPSLYHETPTPKSCAAAWTISVSHETPDIQESWGDRPSWITTH